jgi:hypothetical protein
MCFPQIQVSIGVSIARVILRSLTGTSYSACHLLKLNVNVPVNVSWSSIFKDENCSDFFDRTGSWWRNLEER